MKKTRLILLTALLTLGAFATIIYSSCKKDPCSGVNCLNGGSCSGGTCSCPSGYSGVNCQLSTLVYTNDTYTPITITFNGATSTIPVGSSIAYTGTAGAGASFSAYTSGAFGATITWPAVTDYFPTGGNDSPIPLDVDASYFYLKVINIYSYATTSLVVNVGLTTQTNEAVGIPADGNTYGVGYYLAFANTAIRPYYADLSTSPSPYYLSIPNTPNASYTQTID